MGKLSFCAGKMLLISLKMKGKIKRMSYKQLKQAKWTEHIFLMVQIYKSLGASESSHSYDKLLPIRFDITLEGLVYHVSDRNLKRKG